jgi:CDP-diacylglycerol--serine O-phosphatidyltransferase
MKQIPNLFTLLNLLFGCLAIVAVLQNGIIINVNAEGTELLDVPEKIWMASLFIGIAAVIDFLDGFVARLFNATSDMGKQLDSLADVVSFGVAPGMIIYQFLRLSFAKDPAGVETGLIWLVPAFIIPCAAAWRLARFNLDSTQTYHFKGMPVPAVGLLVASLPMIYFYSNEQWVIDLLLNKWFLYGLVVLLSWLQVSTLPLMAMKFKDYTVKNNLPKYLLLGVAVIAIVLLKWLAVPVIILAYVLLSLLFKNKIA